MSVGVEAEVVMRAPAIAQANESVDMAEAIEDIIASHRAALVALAPRQASRRVREETAWHITELGLLLRVRDAQRQEPQQTQHPAPSGVHLSERGEESAEPDRGTH